MVHNKRNNNNSNDTSSNSTNRVPSIFLAGSSRKCFNCAVLRCTLPWRTRYPLG